MIANSRLRILRFSLVGAIGVGVQLGVLATLIAMKMNYLLATGMAVEAAVLHNFLWHQRFTWADRAGSRRAAFDQLVRFHLSNGLISLVGNLLLMRLLAGWFGMPVLAANLATISLCFVANYLASDRWVFLSGRAITHQQQSALGKRQIDQSRSDSEGQAHPDLRSQQKRRERPKLIKHEDSGEQSQKSPAKASNVERHRRKQIQTNRNADRSRYNQDSDDPGRLSEPMFQQLYDYAQPSQRCHVEAEIHDLNEQKEYTHVSVRNCRQIFGSSEKSIHRRLGNRRRGFGS
jgi:putative flippase GtrA